MTLIDNNNKQMRKKKNISEQDSTNASSKKSILHKHQVQLDLFRNKQNRISHLDSKIKNCKKEIEKIQKEKSYKQLNNELVTTQINQIAKLQRDITKYESEKIHIMSGKDEIDYLLESSQIIQRYIDIEEKENSILSKSEQTAEDAEILNKLAITKSEISDEYLYKFDSNYINYKKMYHTQTTICSVCNESLYFQGGFMVCQSCGLCVNNIESNNELSYKEMQEYDYRPQFTYDKMSHLEDWLRRFQAKENRSIPQEILDKVILEAQKERIRDLNTLNEDKVKRYLKKLNLNEYYDNVIGIINRINGRPPFTLTIEIEEKIKTMFQQIQEPYERYKPQNRKNFLSYSYTLHKIFQILGLHEFAKYFPLLKSSEKLRQQDEIFKKVVAEMALKDKSVNWVFYPSI